MKISPLLLSSSSAASLRRFLRRSPRNPQRDAATLQTCVPPPFFA